MANLVAKIGLGSAQWGMNYGISNTTGKVSPQEIEKILAFARESGIRAIDTAPIYGDAELQIGKYDLSSFAITTKTPRFSSNVISMNTAGTLRASLLSSRRFLGQNIYGLLVHNADDLLKPNGGILIEELQLLKHEGLVKKIGVSIYTADQVNKIITCFVPDIVQLPLSVFDQRLVHDGTLATLRSMGVEIHARSALLQGVLAMQEYNLPEYFSPWKQHINEWYSFCRSMSMPPAHAAIAFVCSIQEIDFCILGIDRLSQLIDILNGIGSTSLFNASSFAIKDPGILNPSNWNLK
jgi:aryl-alcohol dehydrogenase-like predicted oxidoreductase